MFTPTSFKITALSCFVVFLCSGSCNHSRAQSVNPATVQAGYQASNRSTWFLDNPKQKTVVRPPAAAQQKNE